MNYNPQNPPNTPPPGYTPPIPGRPSPSKYLLWSVIAALCAAFLPEIGVLAYAGLSASLIFLTSAKGPLWSFFLPAAGVALLFLKQDLSTDPVTLAVLYTVIAAILSSLAAGGILCRRDGDFHRSLTVYVSVATVAAAALAVMVFRKFDLAPEKLLESGTAYFVEAIDRAAAAGHTTLSPEEIASLKEGAGAMLHMGFYYLPAVVVILIEVCGVVSLRFAGLLHDVNNTAYYHPARRLARLDVGYAVLFFASILLTLAGGDSVMGYSAANVMLVLLVPAIAAGVSAFRESRRRKRAEGRHPGILPIVVLIGIGLYLPAFALYVPAVYGCIAGIKGSMKKK